MQIGFRHKDHSRDTISSAICQNQACAERNISGSGKQQTIWCHLGERMEIFTYDNYYHEGSLV